MQRALDALEPGDALVVARLDRSSRSVQDTAAIMDRAADEGWHLVALDVNVDPPPRPAVDSWPASSAS